MVRIDPKTFESRRGGPIAVPGYDRPLVPTFERTARDRRQSRHPRGDRRSRPSRPLARARRQPASGGASTRKAIRLLRQHPLRRAARAACARRWFDNGFRLPPVGELREVGGEDEAAAGHRRRAAGRGVGADLRDRMSGVPDPHRHRLRNIVGGSAGNLVEWYDWYAYSAFTLYFAPVFFPAGRPHRAIAERGGDLRGRLRDAADRRLDHGHLCRSARAARRG